MSNSILSKVFPLSGEKCPFSFEDQSVSVQLHLQTTKLFSDKSSGSSNFCVLMSQPGLKLHLRNLAFQAAVTNSYHGFETLIISASRWPKSPLELDSEQGLHKMPNLNSTSLDLINFVYPKNPSELFLYISALGGLADVPDFIILDNVENLIGEDSTEVNQKTLAVQKLFGLLNYLSSSKPVRLLVTCGQMEILSNNHLVGNYNLWTDEMWHLSEQLLGLSLTLVSEELYTYQINFDFDLKKKNYFFRTLEEVEND